MPTLHPGLYLISDERMLRNGTFFSYLEQALELGVRVVQLRAKTLPPDDLFCAGREMRRLTRQHQATFIVNDTPDLALKLEADGVHLGQTDMNPEEARRVVGTDFLIGWSTHNKEQIRAARSMPIDYIGVGPVFATKTKENPDPVVGLDLLRWAVENSALPTVGIGGIGLDNVDAVLQTGTHSFAVIGAISQSDDPLAATQAFLRKISDFS